MTNDEEKYIARKAVDKVHDQRRERQLQALRDEERSKIAVALHTSEDVAAEALELGFDATTSSVLPLIPLIQVAWVDGTMTESEAKKVLEIAKARNVHAPEALEFLNMMLAKRPSAVFFERTDRVIAHIIAQDPSNEATSDILELAKAVAEASGGFFGLKNPVGVEEKALLAELAELFNI